MHVTYGRFKITNHFILIFIGNAKAIREGKKIDYLDHERDDKKIEQTIQTQNTLQKFQSKVHVEEKLNI